MNVVVIELDSYSLKYENVLAIGRAFVELGIEVKMWNPAACSALDMIHEVKPDLVFYHSGISGRAVKIINEQNPNIKLVDTEMYKDSVVADVLGFKKVDKYELFQGGQVCILQFPEVEDSENIVLKYKMSVKNTDRFRLFSSKQMAGGKHCGPLPKELHPLLFASADSVLALSVHTAVNARLCNDNVYLAVDGKTVEFSMTPEDLDAVSNVNIAVGYIGESDAV